MKGQVVLSQLFLLLLLGEVGGDAGLRGRGADLGHHGVGPLHKAVERQHTRRQKDVRGKQLHVSGREVVAEQVLLARVGRGEAVHALGHAGEHLLGPLLREAALLLLGLVHDADEAQVGCREQLLKVLQHLVHGQRLLRVLGVQPGELGGVAHDRLGLPEVRGALEAVALEHGDAAHGGLVGRNELGELFLRQAHVVERHAAGVEGQARCLSATGELQVVEAVDLEEGRLGLALLHHDGVREERLAQRRQLGVRAVDVAADVAEEARLEHPLQEEDGVDVGDGERVADEVARGVGLEALLQGAQHPRHGLGHEGRALRLAGLGALRPHAGHDAREELLDVVEHLVDLGGGNGVLGVHFGEAAHVAQDGDGLADRLAVGQLEHGELAEGQRALHAPKLWEADDLVVEVDAADPGGEADRVAAAGHTEVDERGLGHCRLFVLKSIVHNKVQKL
eukprot:PhM_4_TR13320/c0_g2_i1/m.72644